MHTKNGLTSDEFNLTTMKRLNKKCAYNTNVGKIPNTNVWKDISRKKKNLKSDPSPTNKPC